MRRELDNDLYALGVPIQILEGMAQPKGGYSKAGRASGSGLAHNVVMLGDDMLEQLRSANEDTACLLSEVEDSIQHVSLRMWHTVRAKACNGELVDHQVQGNFMRLT